MAESVHFWLKITQFSHIRFYDKIFWIKNSIFDLQKEIFEKTSVNTPGTAGGPGGCDQTLAVERRKNVQK